MRTTLLAGLVVVLVLLSACGGSGAPGEPVGKVEDMLGVWRRTRGTADFREIYMQVRADGAIGFSRLPDKWDYEWMSLDSAFEGTRLSVTETGFRGWEDAPQDVSCSGIAGAASGVYEIQLLENGNLKFVNAQDNCHWRREILTLAEWAPVP